MLHSQQNITVCCGSKILRKLKCLWFRLWKSQFNQFGDDLLGWSIRLRPGPTHKNRLLTSVWVRQWQCMLGSANNRWPFESEFDEACAELCRACVPRAYTEPTLNRSRREWIRCRQGIHCVNKKAPGRGSAAVPPSTPPRPYPNDRSSGWVVVNELRRDRPLAGEL